MLARCRSTFLLSLAILSFPFAVYAQLSPEEELKTLRPPSNMEVSLFASEPMISNPAAIDIDSQGRVWVAEIVHYRGSAKQPPADKIKVLEDTNNDGRADRVTVFAEGLFCPMSICVAGDLVFVATSPDLWVFEDKDHDLRADGPPKKLLTGFGGFNHDHGAHSLVLGSDHKWWMAHGDAGFDVTGTDGSKMAYRWGAMLRGELDGSKLEVIARNFRNPYEIAVSSFGDSYCSDNDNDGNFSTRICWMLEGGDYGWFGRPPAKVPPGTPYGEHWHFRGHLPGYVPATVVTGFGAPCGMCFYEGDTFGPEFKNVPLHVDPGPREVRRYPHDSSGFGMKAQSVTWMTNQGDDYFRADDICAAPDGSLLISDWYDGGVGGHSYNNPQQGRIFRLTPKGQKLTRIGEPGPYETVAGAIEGLKNPNLATQFLAREKLLAAESESVAPLIKLLEHAEPNYRARAMWVLDRIGGEARTNVVAQLKSPESRIRALAVRILRRHGDEFQDAILALEADAARAVRREVILGLPSFERSKADAIWLKFAKAFDGRDRYELETLNIAAGERKRELAERLAANEGNVATISLLQALDSQVAASHLSKALADPALSAEDRASLIQSLGANPSIDAARVVLNLAIADTTDPQSRQLALSILESNLATTWEDLKSEADLSEGVRKLLAQPPLRARALTLIARAGLRSLEADAMKALADETSDEPTRLAAIEAVTQLRLDAAAKTLTALALGKVSTVQQAALRSLVDLQAGAALDPILLGDARFTVEFAKQIADLLLESTGGAMFILQRLERNQLTPAVRAHILANAGKKADPRIRVLFEHYLPEAERPKTLGAAIKPEVILALKGDREHGFHVFMKTSGAYCILCHRVQGIGSDFGPDLSQIGKKYAREALLETILAPSKAMAPEFVPHIAQTDSGKVYVGFLVNKNERFVVLKDTNSKIVRLKADEVESLEPQPKSLMPELVLQNVSAQDAADLLAYLSSLTSNVRLVDKYRVLGPFAANEKGSLDHDFGPEKNIDAVDLSGTFPNMLGNPATWERAPIDMHRGYPAFDQAQWSSANNANTTDLCYYLSTSAVANAAGKAELLIGSDDNCRVWLNGKEVHRHEGVRAINLHDDRIPIELRQGKNSLVLKIENRGAPGGAAVAIVSDMFVEISAD